MIGSAVPSWITVARGSSPILLLAPHGGRRHDLRVPGQHKVNDLLTGEVTRELAAACGASLIVNELLDRNQLDLNRLSQVRRHAPWMLQLLADVLAEMVAEAGHATVLVVHGWNVTQAACDVGIGMREGPDGLVPVRADTATASDAFVAARLRPLQDAAADAGIAVTIGSRYPAAHPNNLLQIFRAVADRESEEPCPVAALCRSAPIEAAQLELAIPLRWPGQRRDRFLALLAAAFVDEGIGGVSGIRARSSERALRSAGGRVTRRRGLQFVAGDMLVMTSIEGGESGPIAGRLVVSQDADRLTLFTGELADSSCTWTIPPLTFESLADGGARVIYEGPLVGFSTLTPFLDLEHGLAGGTLVEGRVDVTFQADRSGDSNGCGERFGDVRGEMVIDGRSHSIAARAVATLVETFAPQGLPSCRIALPASPWGALLLDGDREEPLLWRQDGRLSGALVGTARAAAESLPVRAICDLTLTARSGSLMLEIAGDAGESDRLLGTLERLIPVRRPGREGSVIETTFALVRCDGRYLGWVEISVVAVRPDAGP
jgi:hypothetical protein